MNLPTFLVAALVAVILVAIVAKGISNRKKGKSSCSCGGDCGHCNRCH